MRTLSDNPPEPALPTDEILPILEETLAVGKRVDRTTVRVSTRTETYTEVAEALLERHDVDIVRVPIDRPIEEVPEVRAEGDTTIVPVVGERLIVTKQLVLIEELHIRKRVAQELVKTPVTLRRQHAVVERLAVEDGPSIPAPE